MRVRACVHVAGIRLRYVIVKRWTTNGLKWIELEREEEIS